MNSWTGSCLHVDTRNHSRDAIKWYLGSEVFEQVNLSSICMLATAVLIIFSQSSGVPENQVRSKRQIFSGRLKPGYFLVSSSSTSIPTSLWDH